MQHANHHRTEHTATPTPPDLGRYQRQMRYPPLGESGQRKLAASRALLCGCGALGSLLASTLARAGVGMLRIVDRDFVETSNLQRQVLFDEQDVENQLPKAVAAAEKLRRINSQIEIDPVVADVDHTNIVRLSRDVDILVDGTDNFETRFLINDVAVRHGLPWVYGGCLGADGQSMTILPGETPCLTCLLQDAPPPGTSPTCDTAGILGPVVGVIASLQAMEVIKILSGRRAAIHRGLYVVQLWDNQVRQIDLGTLREQVDCLTCKRREFPWLEGRRGRHTAVLCGRNAVQLSHPGGPPVSLASLADQLRGIGRLTTNQYLLRLQVDDYQITVFADGRAIIGGTENLATARSVYAKYIGS
ncbi:MAG: thiamine biosynthesis protein ThiF [Planctomycetes bacterium RBG_16_64_10]|nr:MAG: thiamine biosynthesis protein ThiF [Planctomycetes bacterium RBG_16_64_10]